METRQKIYLSSLFLLLGIVCFIAGTWVGGFWLGGLSESAIFLSNMNPYQNIYDCGIVGDIECFKQEFSFLAYLNIVHADALVELDITGAFTEQLVEAIAWNQNVLDQL